MPCSAPVRGKTDAKFPWADSIQNDPCGKPIVSSVWGSDVSAQNLCLPHYEMKYGQVDAKPDAATMLLMHMDSLVDERGHPVTAVADAKIDSTQSKFGGLSAFFDGTGDVLSIPRSDDWWFGSSDFTIDCQVRFASIAASKTFAAQYGISADLSWNWTWINTNQMRFDYSINGTTPQNNVVQAWTPVVSQWYHVAVVRQGPSMMFFVDGVMLGAPVNTLGSHSFFNAVSEPLLIGGRASGANMMNGWLDEFRISKGLARWTANFTPPTAPYVVA